VRKEKRREEGRGNKDKKGKGKKINSGGSGRKQCANFSVKCQPFKKGDFPA
jgi:hypothetical protein